MKNLIFAFALVCASAFAQGVNNGSTTTSAGTATQATQKKVTLQRDLGRYCVGSRPNYAVTGTSDLQNQFISWSSSFKPLGSEKAIPYQEGMYPGQRLTNRGGGLVYWSDTGETWKTSQAGFWSKTATVGGYSDTVTFEVAFCDPREARSFGMYLAPASGTTFFDNLQTSAGTADIYALMEGPADKAMIKGWRVTLNNQPITSLVASLPARFVNLYEVQQVFGYYSGGLGIHIPLPLTYMQTGRNYIEVQVDLQDGGQLLGYADYILRPVDDVIRDFVFTLPTLPDEPLKCQITLLGASPTAKQPVSFGASGGNGSFFWSTSAGSPTTGEGRWFLTTFENSGNKTVTVRSGNQSADCTFFVFPTPTPLPTVPAQQ